MKKQGPRRQPRPKRNDIAPARGNQQTEMTPTTSEAPVNTGHAQSNQLVPLFVPLWLRERIKETAAILLGDESDETLQRYLVEQIGCDYLARMDAGKFQASMVREWIMKAEKKRTALAVFAAACKRWNQEEENQPLGKPKLLLLPTDVTAPIFLNERTARYVRECCDIAGVDPDEWVEGWIGAQVKEALDGQYDVKIGGIAYDLTEEHTSADGGDRSSEEIADLYEKFREVAFRYQQEVKAEQEAAASVEGGAE